MLATRHSPSGRRAGWRKAEPFTTLPWWSHRQKVNVMIAAGIK